MKSKVNYSIILFIIISIFCFGVALGLTYPLISLVMFNHGYSDDIIGLNASCSALGMFISTLIIPKLSSHISMANLIKISLLLSSFVIFGFATDIPLTLWFVLRFILGFLINIVFVISEALLQTECSEINRGRVVAIYTSAMASGYAIGPLGIQLFPENLLYGFITCSLLILILSIICIMFVNITAFKNANINLSSFALFVSMAPNITFMVFVFAFIDAAAISLFPVYFIQHGLSQKSASFTVTILFIGVLFSTPIIGYSLDKFNRNTIAFFCSVISAFCCVVIPMAIDNEYLLWFLILLLGGAFTGIYTCALTSLGEYFKGELLIAGSAVISLSYSLGAFAGPYTSGLFMKTTASANTLFYVFFCVLSILSICICLYRNSLSNISISQ